MSATPASRGPRSARACPPSSTAATVLAERVEDRADNLTRFVWLARAGRRQPPADGPHEDLDRLLGLQRHVAGALVDVLRELSDRDINLTKIESRPRRVRAGPLHVLRRPRRARADAARAEALAALGSAVETLRVLGSYRAATA